MDRSKSKLEDEKNKATEVDYYHRVSLGLSVPARSCVWLPCGLPCPSTVWLRRVMTSQSAWRNAHTQKYINTHINMHTRTRTHRMQNTYTHALALSYTKHIDTHARTHIACNIHTHAHTLFLSHTLTHTHTHSDTQTKHTQVRHCQQCVCVVSTQHSLLALQSLLIQNFRFIERLAVLVKCSYSSIIVYT